MNNDELERIFKEEVMAKLKYYPGICIYWLRKNDEEFRFVNMLLVY
jgi:hypothetical protein